MNKRQRKKQFKKNCARNQDKIPSTINSIPDMVRVIVDGFADLFKTIIKFMGELPQKVHDMPEDEFQRIVNDPELCEENRQLLIKLRNKGGD